MIISLFINVILIAWIIYDKINTVKIQDALPLTESPRNCWLKLQNEGAKYIKRTKNGNIYLKIKR